ncbi:MAG: methionyl-tRNA synthetase, methionyl-tRNA synthetase [Microgenomates group bacterium GW2011_GWC1_44_37]|uniref:methionine--tRNA ligase n=1 Tax=Candidatus Collierbacteria bacterium GW2011_GWB2_44_22 TaxID=1618387 RepID=A0A0G1HVQ9_9BACT|nr:MAG: Methionine-tRNA ligase [Candidatus Collierbacteria bacterium GW2011_GWA2_44_13]KKT49628.1 MAG: Methionine-tRNA ligase [Candidatus Collierbacteria bacterium GW2011_GWB1_44_197]KKT51161.1 MAG: Methionine-tRNA ligase [Candidatus Collierbacteria bacterium GW2011_GWB2_44_22]KKT61422.1 MAG: Methionine-tRNA ligase [Candidatus Collierbacteria bacterium GW2011_GWD1_44_27]KKT64674.1 MAG: Methionine-tRNA ligase [Candidatus Collierbacteria bacterium GW2011_GWC2_44_30]KKT68213.1 MAG: methionyl-tRNA
MGKFYITTTTPYVNAEPHIGFALEIIRADVLARMHRMVGDEVFFNTGTDEHGQKIYQKAMEAGMDPKAYCDEYAAKFGLLKTALNLSYDNFIRTTDEHHLTSAQAFWKICAAKGDIYKKIYKIKYCVGCELEKTDSELIDEKCPIHPTQEIQIIEEENYFFKFSNYQQKLLDFYEKNSDFVIPDFRQNEIKTFVKAGLQDFSISRLKAKMPWGVDVPDDPTQVIYVWFDALINYISALGWPEDQKKFATFWPGAQVCGKDNLRQQTAMWQAMLMSAGLPTSKQIFVGGFLTSGGQKISKSLGNVINPIEWAEKYGADALRYFLLGEVSVFEDSDVTVARFEEAYQSSLANGIGNLAARVATMAEKIGLKVPEQRLGIREAVVNKLSVFRFDEAIKFIWEDVKTADTLINQREVWKLTGEEQEFVLADLVRIIRQIAADLVPFMPETAKKLMAQFGGEVIIRGDNLFQRIER